MSWIENAIVRSTGITAQAQVQWMDPRLNESFRHGNHIKVQPDLTPP